MQVKNNKAFELMVVNYDYFYFSHKLDIIIYYNATDFEPLLADSKNLSFRGHFWTCGFDKFRANI